VHDTRHGIDVNAARRDVGGDQDVGTTAAECLERGASLCLRPVAVDDHR